MLDALSMTRPALLAAAMVFVFTMPATGLL